MNRIENNSTTRVGSSVLLPSRSFLPEANAALTPRSLSAGQLYLSPNAIWQDYPVLYCPDSFARQLLSWFISSLFLSIAERYSIVWINNNLFAIPRAHEHLELSQFGAVIHKVATSILIQGILSTSVFTSLG